MTLQRLLWVENRSGDWCLTCFLDSSGVWSIPVSRIRFYLIVTPSNSRNSPWLLASPLGTLADKPHHEPTDSIPPIASIKIHTHTEAAADTVSHAHSLCLPTPTSAARRQILKRRWLVGEHGAEPTREPTSEQPKFVSNTLQTRNEFKSVAVGNKYYYAYYNNNKIRESEWV